MVGRLLSFWVSAYFQGRTVNFPRCNSNLLWKRDMAWSDHLVVPLVNIATGVGETPFQAPGVMITIVMNSLLHPWSLKKLSLWRVRRKGPKRKRRKSSKHFFSEAFAACFSGRVTENPLGMIPRSESWKHHAITDCNWDIKTKFYVDMYLIYCREREREWET